MGNLDLEVQLGAKLADFDNAMDDAVSKAESAVGNIEKAFSDLNPTFNASILSAGILGAVGGMSALLGFASKVNHELSEMERTAREVGVSVEKFQALRFSANVSGVDSEKFAAGLEKSVGLLNDAQRNSNTLSELFAANGLKIRDNNGQLISTNQLLNNAAGLINRAASEQDKIKIAQMLGLTREWVPALEKGADAFQHNASEAERLGLIIQQSTIDKAKKFDEEWTRSATVLSTQIRAAAADAAVWLTDLIDKAARYVDTLARANGAGEGNGQEKFNAIADALAIISKDAAGLAQDIEQVNRQLDLMRAKPGVDPATIEFLEGVQAKAKAAADELQRANAARAALLGEISKENFPNGVPLPSARPKAPSGPATVIPPKRDGNEEGRDPFDVSVDQANRRIAILNAETATIGLNSEARERARLVAILEEAAKRANTEAGLENTAVTEAQRAQIDQLATSMEKAAQRNRLMTEAMNNFRELGSAAAEAFKGLTLEGKKFDEVLKNLLNRLASRGIDTVFNQLFNSLGASFLGNSSGGGSLFAGLGNGIGRNAQGTDNWRGGPTWVGENGPEILNIPRGAQIIPNDVARKSGGGMSVSFGDTIINGSGLSKDELAAAIAQSQADTLRKVPKIAVSSVQAYNTRVA